MKLTVSTLRKIIKEEVEKTLNETAGTVDYHNAFLTALTSDPDLWDDDAQWAASSAVTDAEEGKKMNRKTFQDLSLIFTNVGVPVPKTGAEMISALRAYLAACKEFDDSQPVL